MSPRIQRLNMSWRLREMRAGKSRSTTVTCSGFANKIRNEGTRKVVRETTIDHQSGASSLPGPYMIKLDTHGYEVPFLYAGDGVLA